VTLLEGVFIALKSEDEPLQVVRRKLLAARYAGLDCPGALEFLDLLLEVPLFVRQRAGPAGRGETDGAEQCYERDSHTCSPRDAEDSGAEEEGGRESRPSFLRPGPRVRQLASDETPGGFRAASSAPSRTRRAWPPCRCSPRGKAAPRAVGSCS